MLEYIVTIHLDPEIAETWQTWMLDVHIPDVLATGCFHEARLARILEPAADDNAPGFEITYLTDSPETYRAYAADHAPALQADHGQRYAGRFRASRRLLERQRVFQSP